MTNYSGNNINIKILFVHYLSGLRVSKKTKNNYVADSNHFFKWIESLPTQYSASELARNLNKNIIKNYIKDMIQKNTPQRTINRRLTTLRHLSKYLVDYGYTSESAEVKNLKSTTNNISIKPLFIGIAAITVFTITGLYLGKASAINSLANTEHVELNSDTNPKIYIIDSSQNPNMLKSTKTSTYSLAKVPVSITLKDEFPIDPNSSNEFIPNSDEADYGHGIIPAGSTQATIHSPSVKTTSVVLITPLNNYASFYVSNLSNGYFTVKLDIPSDQTLAFNWMVR